MGDQHKYITLLGRQYKVIECNLSVDHGNSTHHNGSGESPSPTCKDGNDEGNEEEGTQSVSLNAEDSSIDSNTQNELPSDTEEDIAIVNESENADQNSLQHVEDVHSNQKLINFDETESDEVKEDVMKKEEETVKNDEEVQKHSNDICTDSKEENLDNLQSNLTEITESNIENNGHGAEISIKRNQTDVVALSNAVGINEDIRPNEKQEDYISDSEQNDLADEIELELLIEEDNANETVVPKFEYQASIEEPMGNSPESSVTNDGDNVSYEISTEKEAFQSVQTAENEEMIDETNDDESQISEDSTVEGVYELSEERSINDVNQFLEETDANQLAEEETDLGTNQLSEDRPDNVANQSTEYDEQATPDYSPESNHVTENDVQTAVQGPPPAYTEEASSAEEQDVMRVSLSEKFLIVDYAKSEWKGTTYTAECVRKGYAKIITAIGCSYMRQVRGDNYCALRATVFQILTQSLPILQSADELTRLPDRLQEEYKCSWLKHWTFANRLPSDVNNRFEVMHNCLEFFTEQLNASHAIDNKDDREAHFLALFNSGSNAEIKLFEAVKLIMLESAVKLYADNCKGIEVPVFVWLLFARDTSSDPESLMINHLNSVGNSGGLEQVEMFLLGQALELTIRVVRPSNVFQEDFITHYPDHMIDKWPKTNLIAEDDRHYNVLV